MARLAAIDPATGSLGRHEPIDESDKIWPSILTCRKN